MKKELILLLSLVAFLSIGGLYLQSISQIPPIKNDYFSPSNVIEHVKQIAKVPHPSGSLEIIEVREYLVDTIQQMGVEYRLQSTEVNVSNSEKPVEIVNIIGRIPGTSSSKAILLMAHYDSVPTGPGASDNGANVGALLEVMEKVKKNYSFKNDIIFLFTDGEELGLLGAREFNNHFNMVDIGLVINLEARGNKGKSYLFETSDNNKTLLTESFQAIQYPVAYSFFTEMYKLMPNDTDYTVFKENNISGINFAFAQGVEVYHGMEDNIQNLTIEAINHNGVNAMDLVQYFGSYDFTNLTKTTENSVYFNTFGSNIIHFSDKWNSVLFTLVFILFVTTLYIGIKTQQIKMKSVANILIVKLLIAAITFTGGTFLMIISQTWEMFHVGLLTNTISIILGVIMLVSLLFTYGLIIYLRSRLKKHPITHIYSDYRMPISSAIILIVVSFITLINAPGMHYLFSATLLFSLLPMIAGLLLKEKYLYSKFAITIIAYAFNLILLLPFFLIIMFIMEIYMAIPLTIFLLLLFLPIHVPVFLSLRQREAIA